MTYDWYKKIGSPQYVVAPMVDASELAWRMLCRNHGAQLCYSPMYHSTIFVKDSKYRRDSLASCDKDRPLIIQFCGNNPEIMVEAAKLAEGHCDAIDINLGCPQAIAKRGRYGSYLQDEWDLLKKIVQEMSKAVSVPITCKIRIFPSIEKSVEYATMLQEAGCKLLTVHGRTREQKGPLTGIASWTHLKAVREAISVPMFANGNIQCLEDVHRCIHETNVDGVMSAEGNLTNPAIFQGINPVSWDMVEEYLDLVQVYPCPTSYVRGHVFKMFHKIFTFEDNNSDREILATGKNLEDFRQVCSNIKQKYLPYHEGIKHFESDENIYRQGFNLILPPWICQPYVRMPPDEHKQKMENLNKEQDLQPKRGLEDFSGDTISRKKMKKLRRIMRRPKNQDIEQAGRNGDICVHESCPNPLGGKCVYKLCKKCCRNKCFKEDLDCEGHKILVRSRRQMARQFANLQSCNTENEITQSNTYFLI